MAIGVRNRGSGKYGSLLNPLFLTRIRFAHRDILHPAGAVDKQPLDFPSLNLAFTFAVQDLRVSALVSLRLREGADRMKKGSVIKKNLDLLDEFMK
jgi:hypothetical protein